MVEAFLRRRLADLGVQATVSSAGRLSEGLRADADAVRALSAVGIDASTHRSRRLTAASAAKADLVLAMARDHVRHAVSLDEGAWPRCFTIKQLVRRGEEVGPRSPGQPFDEWLAKVHAGRERADLVGAAPDDDVADPIGGGREVFRRTAVELDDLTARLVDLAWARATTRRDHT